MHKGFFIWAAMIALIFTGCSSKATVSSTHEDIYIYAAASLKGLMDDVKLQYEKAHPDVELIMNYAGTHVLKTQIEQGAEADLFISARERDIQDLQTSGYLSVYSLFAGNQLIIAVSKEGSEKIGRIEDLSREGVRLVLAEQKAPVGEYSRLSLEKLQQSGQYGDRFMQDVLANVVSNESNEQNVLAKVTLGEADAGIVYTSSLSGMAAQKNGIKTLTIPSDVNITSYYYSAPLKNAAEGTASLQAWLNSEKGKVLIEKHGYLVER